MKQKNGIVWGWTTTRQSKVVNENIAIYHNRKCFPFVVPKPICRQTNSRAHTQKKTREKSDGKTRTEYTEEKNMLNSINGIGGGGGSRHVHTVKYVSATFSGWNCLCCNPQKQIEKYIYLFCFLFCFLSHSFPFCVFFFLQMNWMNLFAHHMPTNSSSLFFFSVLKMKTHTSNSYKSYRFAIVSIYQCDNSCAKQINFLKWLKMVNPFSLHVRVLYSLFSIFFFFHFFSSDAFTWNCPFA